MDIVRWFEQLGPFQAAVVLIQLAHTGHETGDAGAGFWDLTLVVDHLAVVVEDGITLLPGEDHGAPTADPGGVGLHHSHGESIARLSGRLAALYAEQEAEENLMLRYEAARRTLERLIDQRFINRNT